MTGELSGMAHWLGERSRALSVTLEIPRSRYVSERISKQCSGLAEVLATYRWKTTWSTAGGRPCKSEDWPTTRMSLGSLRRWLNSVVDDDAAPAHDVRDVALREVEWGGGARSAGKGADQLLRTKAEDKTLQAYLRRSRVILREAWPEDSRLREIELMNSMLTKVHALLADDGLPIYDSRVACALGVLVELYRREAGRPWRSVPDVIRFPAISRERSVPHAVAEAVSPGQIHYSSPHATIEWVRAKLRARNLLAAILSSNPTLYGDEGDFPARMHAFEATLFMIGASPRALTGAVTGTVTRNS